MGGESPASGVEWARLDPADSLPFAASFAACPAPLAMNITWPLAEQARWQAMRLLKN